MENPKKSVCFFLREFPVLSETFVVQQINSLIELGHEVSIVALYSGDRTLFNHGIFGKENLEEKTTYLLPNKTRKRNKFTRVLSVGLNALKLSVSTDNLPILFGHLPKYIRAGKLIATDELLSVVANKKQLMSAEVIIAHFGQIGVLAAYLKKFRVIDGDIYTVFHGFELSMFSVVDKWKDLYVWLSRNSKKLLPISDLWAEKLEAFGVDRQSIQVHHMGIDLSIFLFEEKPINTPLKLITVARATEKKGLKFALEAIELCKSEVEYHIIGGGELLPQLKEQVLNFKSRSRIIFHGPQSSDFVASKLRESDVFVLTSVRDAKGDMEGIPVSLMEAMASGVLVLSTVHSGIPELITDNHNGFLVPERDSVAIANTIDKICALENSSDIRNAALLKVTNEFNQKRLSKTLSKFI